jgi:hypothetical protein
MYVSYSGQVNTVVACPNDFGQLHCLIIRRTTGTKNCAPATIRSSGIESNQSINILKYNNIIINKIKNHQQPMAINFVIDLILIFIRKSSPYHQCIM